MLFATQQPIVNDSGPRWTQTHISVEVVDDLQAQPPRCPDRHLFAIAQIPWSPYRRKRHDD